MINNLRNKEDKDIGTLVINYDKLSKLEIEGKKLTNKEEYVYHLEKSIIASLHNVTDKYSSNINEAESYLKNKISELTNDSEQVMDFLKQVNELLELAVTETAKSLHCFRKIGNDFT